MAKRSTIGENPLDAVNQENPLDTVVPDLSAVASDPAGGNRRRRCPPKSRRACWNWKPVSRRCATEVAGLKATAARNRLLERRDRRIVRGTGRTAP